MNRKEFLNALRKRLSFLNKEELEREILYYINEIDKSSEEDKKVIESFGSMDDIVKSIALKYNRSFEEKMTKPQEYYNNLKGIGNVIRESDNQTRIKILKDLLILIVITCVCKIPFIFIRDIGDNIIDAFFDSNMFMLSVWGLWIELFYVACALLFFYKTIKKYFEDLKK